MRTWLRNSHTNLVHIRDYKINPSTLSKPPRRSGSWSYLNSSPPCMRGHPWNNQANHRDMMTYVHIRRHQPTFCYVPAHVVKIRSHSMKRESDPSSANHLPVLALVFLAVAGRHGGDFVFNILLYALIVYLENMRTIALKCLLTRQLSLIFI